MSAKEILVRKVKMRIRAECLRPTSHTNLIIPFCVFPGSILK